MNWLTEKKKSFNDMTPLEYLREFPYNTVGISNMLNHNGNETALYCLEFYEIDSKLTTKIIQVVWKMFHNDINLIKTKHGIHFVSFAISPFSPERWKQRVRFMSEKLDQDYGGSSKFCCLRIAPKYHNDVIISERPVYYRNLRLPKRGSYVSKLHLDQYKIFNRFPQRLYDFYKSKCQLIEVPISYIMYRTERG